MARETKDDLIQRRTLNEQRAGRYAARRKDMLGFLRERERDLRLRLRDGWGLYLALWYDTETYTGKVTINVIPSDGERFSWVDDFDEFPSDETFTKITLVGK